jgi:hypothetical protein
MMSDPDNSLPPAVRKQIKARTLSGKPITAEEVEALLSSL